MDDARKQYEKACSDKELAERVIAQLKADKIRNNYAEMIRKALRGN